MTDNDLVRKIIGGDENSFTAFINLYSASLYYYALGIIKQKEYAEEIVSDVFYEVWKNKKQLVNIRNIKAWLFVITHRKCISSLRKEKHLKNKVLIDEIDDFYIASFQTPDHEIISKEELDCINRAIEELPPKCKQVFFLAKIEKLPYVEIADLLNISVKTINNHIAYALGSISKKLDFPKKK